jgi:hypothetical protein
MVIDPRRIEVMDDRVADVMRRKTSGEKLLMLDEAWRFGWSISEAGVRRQHPSWTDEAIRRETVRRMSRGAF